MAVKKENPQPRGRPRSATARRAILSAASQLFESGGLGAVTMEAVARLAGVGKPTVYRNWGSREELAMAALINVGAPKTNVRETASAFDDLYRQLVKVAQSFATPFGRNAALMVASADADSELTKAFRNQVLLASREEGRMILRRAAVEHSISLDFDIDVTLDMIYGPIFYRLLVGHKVPDVSFIQELLRQVKLALQSRHDEPI